MRIDEASQFFLQKTSEIHRFSRMHFPGEGVH
jgi:hypothetical protein